MYLKKSIIAMTAVAAFIGLAAGGAAAAPNIPCKTAKLIVPWKAGGGTHVIFSIFEKTIQNLDVTPKIKVVTVGGQGGNKGAKEAARAKPDGCTLFAIHQSAITSYLNGHARGPGHGQGGRDLRIDEPVLLADPRGSDRHEVQVRAL